MIVMTDPRETLRIVENLRAQAEKKRDEEYKAHWEELEEYIAPGTCDFDQISIEDGRKKYDKIIDGTAGWAVGVLAAGMTSGLTSPARPWFQLSLEGAPMLSEETEVKIWLAETEQVLRDMMIKSNLYNVLPNVYADLAIYGTSAFGIFRDTEELVRCYHYPIGSYSLAVGQTGRVDTFFRHLKMTVRQLRDTYPEENLSHQVMEAIKGHQLEQEIDVVHAIFPNRDFHPMGLEGNRRKYREMVYEISQVGNGVALLDSGYSEFPIIGPRWNVRGNAVYGMSPCQTVLGDIKALQLAHKRKAQGLEKQIRPSLQGPTQLRGKRVSLRPAALNLFDAASDRGGLRPVHEVKFPYGDVLNDISEHQQRIKQALFVDMFLALLASDRRQMTAREVEERREEKLLMLGPVLERLNDEQNDRIINRFISVASERRLLPEPPQEIEDMEIKIEYISILAQAQKFVELARIERFLGSVGQIATFMPEVLNVVDGDAVVRTYADVGGITPKILRSPEAVMQIRQEIAQQQAAQQQLAATNEAANAAKTMSQSNLDSNNVLTQLLGPAAGAQAGAPGAV